VYKQQLAAACVGSSKLAWQCISHLQHGKKGTWQLNMCAVSTCSWLQVMDLGRRGIRSLAVARTNDEGKWQMMGILTFLDPPRSDTKITIERALEYGVDVKMITGACAAVLACAAAAAAAVLTHCLCIRGISA
jgi:cation transport ATPase